jgi:hypothetical protein
MGSYPGFGIRRLGVSLRQPKGFGDGGINHGQNGQSVDRLPHLLTPKP